MTKTIVITGGSRGIGAAIARAAACEGYRTVINYHRSQAEAEALRSELVEQGAEVITVQADVSTSEGAAKLFSEVDSVFGSIDVLIANAGITGAMVPIEEFDEERIATVLASNVHSLVFCAREAVRRMSTKHGGKGGSIVVMSSVAARLGGMRGMLAYTVSKGAADAFTLGMSRELIGTGIRINALRPGMIETGIHDVIGGKAALAQAAPMIPLGRIGHPDEVAEAALWLASDKASYVHGALLDITGGR
ncbi:SDR family oxidoreductase [Pseudomonas gingeri]|uniref:SDR family oxidoreductase n=1 Tax=Pseudomonas gingeri TaxID=117681 RepID=A0A7Y7XDZ3_9PSED|nr:SDR family oxidoreductase [Pseudomonas gingeri]NWB97018.1 SDR family oxidoreductase [Pseudomonas gingeri]